MDSSQDFADAVEKTRKFFSLKVSEPEILNPLAATIHEQLAAGVLPRWALAMHCGSYWHIIVNEGKCHTEPPSSTTIHEHLAARVLPRWALAMHYGSYWHIIVNEGKCHTEPPCCNYT